MPIDPERDLKIVSVRKISREKISIFPYEENKKLSEKSLIGVKFDEN